jgi:dUTP pyrophosphatase
MIIMENIGTETIEFDDGSRVAQGVIAPVLYAEHKEVDELPDSNRGSDGFGSTGV